MTQSIDIRVLTEKNGDKRYRPARSFRDEAPVTWGASAVVMPKADMLVAMASASKTSIYLPSIVNIPDDVPGKLGDYYVYWSTDHDSNTGGIFMAYADHPMGPWTPKTFAVDTVHKFGTAYCDNGYVTGGGNQTETPWVVDTFVNGPERFRMFYQNNATGKGAQTTCLAVSPDGLDWTRKGHALNFPSLDLPGDGHTGYATVYQIGDRWVAYSSAGGGDFSRQAIWYSNNGTSFTMDRRMFVYQTDMTGDSLLRVSMALRLFQWRGELWGNFALKSPSAGAGGGGIPSQYQSVVAKMRHDLRGFVGGIYPISFGANSYVEHDGRLYGLSVNTTTGLVAASIGA